MSDPHCHASDSPRDAKDLVLRVLTVERVARWCKVGQAAVYQWLHRGTAEAPVPSVRVPAIAEGAAAEGLDFEMGMLWPAMAGWTAKRFAAPPEHVRSREDVQ